MNDTESTIDDATAATETIVLDDKIDQKSDDDDDSEFYLYKGPATPFMLRKFPRDINNSATTTDETKPAVNNAMSPIDPIILPPAFPFRNQPKTHEQFLRFEELADSNLIPHDSTYENDSTDSNLDYFQDEGDDYKRVDSYDFVHTDPYTPMDIPQEHDEYHNYLDKHYSIFDDGYSLTHMQKLTDKDIANNIKEINNDVTRVNFDANYSYQRKQMVVNKFDAIFQGIIDADPSCTFP